MKIRPRHQVRHVRDRYGTQLALDRLREKSLHQQLPTILGRRIDRLITGLFGAILAIATTSSVVAQDRVVEQIREDCDKLVRQDVYRKAKATGLFWPGHSRHKFWTFEIAIKTLFDSRLTFLEVARQHFISYELDAVGAKDPKWRDEENQFLRIYLADGTSPYCAPFDLLTRRRPSELISLINKGLTPYQCVAIEPISNPVADLGIETNSAIRNEMEYVRERLLDSSDQSVVAEYLVIQSEHMSNSAGGYACENNIRAYSGFPWTALEVIRTEQSPMSRTVIQMSSTLTFPETREHEALVQAIETPAGVRFTSAMSQQNAILRNGAIAIVSGTALQFVEGDKLRRMRLDGVASGKYSFSVIRETADRLVLFGTNWIDRYAILEFTHAGDPVRIDLVPIPGEVTKRSHLSLYFNFTVEKSSYVVDVHFLEPYDSQDRVHSTVRLTLQR